MLRDYEKGDVVEYSTFPKSSLWAPREAGLVVDVEYKVKSDDFLVYIMWPNGLRPQALFQKDCHKRGLRIVN